MPPKVAAAPESGPVKGPPFIYCSFGDPEKKLEIQVNINCPSELCIDYAKRKAIQITGVEIKALKDEAFRVKQELSSSSSKKNPRGEEEAGDFVRLDQPGEGTGDAVEADEVNGEEEEAAIQLAKIEATIAKYENLLQDLVAETLVLELLNSEGVGIDYEHVWNAPFISQFAS